jgi:hypothetical protein
MDAVVRRDTTFTLRMDALVAPISQAIADSCTSGFRVCDNH